MVSLIEINKAINYKVKKALSDSEFSKVPIIASDLSEPVVRPSIKISLDDATTGKMNSCMKERTLTVRVYFFATDVNRSKLENTKVRDLIENEFLTPIKVSETFYIDVDEVETMITDNVLILSCDIETLELIPENILDDGIEYDIMENLNFNLGSEE